MGMGRILRGMYGMKPTISFSNTYLKVLEYCLLVVYEFKGLIIYHDVVRGSDSFFFSSQRHL
jgi:hypothetical protein